MIESTVDFIKWSAPLLGAVIAWLVNERWKRGEHRREVKRKACLEALAIVDAHFSNQDWSGIDDPERQPSPSIERAREVYNNLCLACNDGDVLESYKKCLGFYGPFNAGDIVGLRSAIRNELGFGKLIDTNRQSAWIARINRRGSSADA